MRLALPVAALLAATFFVPASGAAPPLACGDVVTEDVTLSASLSDCATGLVVGADNITIDLNGYAIKGLGSGSGVGVQATDRTGITVKNGKITDFAQGVSLFNTSQSTVERLVIRRTLTGIRVSRTNFDTDANQILNNTVRDSGDGIFAFGAAGSRLEGNDLAHLTGTGIFCRDTFSSEVAIVGNRSVRNDTGIRLDFCAASVDVNTTSHNAGAGISRTRSMGTTLRNVANDNGGIGINVDDSPGVIDGNVTNRNGGHGLAIVDQISTYGPFYTVTANTANRNGELGIMTTLIGVVDGGSNHARHNANPLECMGVTCS